MKQVRKLTSQQNLKDIPEYHNLYIIRLYGKDITLLKFGYSENIIKRLMSYIRHNPLMEIVYTTYRVDAKDFEHYFHTNNESYCGNEWYEERYLDKILDDIENLKDIEDLKDTIVVAPRGPRCDFKDYVERLQELEYFLKEGNEDL